MPFAPTPNFDERKAHDPSQDQSIDRSYARLCEFRKSWNAGDTVDEESGLTVDDLDTVLAHLAGTLS